MSAPNPILRRLGWLACGWTQAVLAWATPWAPAQAAEASPVTRPVSAPAGAASSAAPAPTPAAAGTAASGPVHRAAAYELDIDTPESQMTALLRRHLDLSRWQSTTVEGELEEDELARLMAGTPDEVKALLRTMGHYKPQVTVKSERLSGKPVRVLVQVVPGPSLRVRSVRLELQGELQERESQQDAAARKQWQQLQAGWLMEEGQVFSQEAWGQAKGSLLEQLRAQAYPAAEWSGTAASVDADLEHVDLFLVLDSGPRFQFGRLEVEGLKHQTPDSVMNWRPFEWGEAYSSDKLTSFQDRLRKSNLFESVTVDVDPRDPDPAQATVRVRVKEQQLQAASLGLGWSREEGARITASHQHRRPWDLPWTVASKVQLAQRESSLTVDARSQAKEGGVQQMAAGSVSTSHLEGLRVRDQYVRWGRSADNGQYERLQYVQWRGSTSQVDGDPLSVRATAMSLHSDWTRRELDHEWLPTRGYALSMLSSVGVTQGRSFDGDNVQLDSGRGGFVRLQGRAQWFRPWMGGYASARLDLGQVFKGAKTAIPESMLFRAGGDDSVRGYAAESLGPKRGSSTVGGDVMAAASLEWAHVLSRRRPEWLGAFFVDAGQSADRWRELRPVAAWGLGARWRSPLGLLKLDLAWPQTTHRPRLHLNMGVKW